MLNVVYNVYRSTLYRNVWPKLKTNSGETSGGVWGRKGPRRGKGEGEGMTEDEIEVTEKEATGRSSREGESSPVAWKRHAVGVSWAGNGDGGMPGNSG
jgi:hypothetical protein